ncbi:MAG TPA: NTPase [Anaerolineae bacterium]|nr:NTPase [Anaerolineae bacterium]
MGRTILLTGHPGVGKTTIIREIAESLGDSAGGFYTAEIRERGRRQGFKIVTLHGEEGILSHVDVKGPARVSKYGVNLRDLEGIGVAALIQAVANGRCVVVDEIGKMELLSQRFREVVLAAIEGDSTVVGTVLKARNPWVDDLKALPQVTILEVTEANRDHMAQRVLSLLDITSTAAR